MIGRRCNARMHGSYPDCDCPEPEQLHPVRRTATPSCVTSLEATIDAEDPFGKWCLSCERVTRASEADGNICDECLADRVELADDEHCAACGSPGRSLCEGCRVRDLNNAPGGGGAGDLLEHSGRYTPDTRFEVA